MPAATPRIADPAEVALLFLHIPKTAGTSINLLLDRHFPPAVTVSFDSDIQDGIRRFRVAPPAALDHVRCVRGHQPFGLHVGLPRPAVYFTLLRDPVERVVSRYFFARLHPAEYQVEPFVRENWDLDAALASGLSPELENGQVRLLCGDHAVDGMHGIAPPTRASLVAAKRNLREHFVTVGLTEQYQTSIRLLCGAFGWTDSEAVRTNVTDGRPVAVPSRIRRAIESANELDIELYELGRQLFAEQAAAAGLALEPERRGGGVGPTVDAEAVWQLAQARALAAWRRHCESGTGSRTEPATR